MGYNPWGHQESNMTEQLTLQFRALKKARIFPRMSQLLLCFVFLFSFFSNSQVFLQQRWVYSRSAKNCNSGSAPMDKPHANSYTARKGEHKFCLLRTESCIDFLKGPKVLWVGGGQSHRLWKPEMTQESSSVLKAEASGTHSFIRYLLCSFCARFCTRWSENQ